MNTAVYEAESRPRRSPLPWLIPVQIASAFTVWAIAAGGQLLRTWMFTAIAWLLTLPLLVSLEASLMAMMFFEPLRGIIRRAQYIFLEYDSQDPIHVITPVVTIFALISVLRIHRLTILRATPMAGSVSLLVLVYILEIFNPLQGGLIVGLSGGMFILVPVVWFYFGQYATERFITNALRLMIVLGLLTSLWGVYQLRFGYPAFEQYWITNTEFYSSIAVGRAERALATFCSAEEWARYTELGAIAAFGFAAGYQRLMARVGWVLAGLALVGFLLLSGQRAAVFGLGLGLLVLFMLGAGSFKAAVARALLVLTPFAVVLALAKPPEAEDMFSNDETQAISTVLSHTKRGVLKPAGEDSFQERLTNWSYMMIDVVPYRPLGMGIGGGTLSEFRFSGTGENLPPIDSSILLNAITCGYPGLLLFVWILMFGTWLSIRIARRAAPDDPSAMTKRIIAAAVCALVLNTMFGMTFMLYSVAPLAWLFLGWISAETLRTGRESEREVITI
jgi:O-Antigen ligase